MNAVEKIRSLKGMVLQKRDLEAQKKDLSDCIKINDETIENTIMDEGDVRACREMLKKNAIMISQKKEVSSKIKMIADEMEKLILNEGEYDGQADIFDEIGKSESAAEAQEG